MDLVGEDYLSARRFLQRSDVVGTVAERAERDIYISNWYTIGGFIFTPILGVVAIIPSYQIGLGQVAVQGFFMHNAVGMWFTFLALGVTYYALPKLLNRPSILRARRLGFWTNLVFYPIIGAHHFEFTPLPWWFQTLAIVFSVGMLVPVWAGTGNFGLRCGAAATIRCSYALPFIWVGVLYYFLGRRRERSRRCAACKRSGTLRTIRSDIHTRRCTGSSLHRRGALRALRRATGKPPQSRIACGLHFWSLHLSA